LEENYTSPHHSHNIHDSGEGESQTDRHLLMQIVTLSLLAFTMLWLCLMLRLCLMLILAIILSFGVCTI
jgi:hypothetical protein